jgi:hypothetical protein
MYTTGFLRDRRLLSHNPVPIHVFESAAKGAVEKRIPGIVSYFFERDATFQRAEAAWQSCCEEIARAANAGEPPAIPEIPAETVMQVLCIAAQSAKALAEAPFLAPAWVTTMNGSKSVEAENGATYSISGTGKAWPLNASQQVREKLNI